MNVSPVSQTHMDGCSGKQRAPRARSYVSSWSVNKNLGCNLQNWPCPVPQKHQQLSLHLPSQPFVGRGLGEVFLFGVKL